MKSHICIKATFNFFQDKLKMKDYDRANVRLFDIGFYVTHNIFERIVWYFMSPENVDHTSDYVVFECEYEDMKEYEKHKRIGIWLEQIMYKNWDRMVDFLKMYGEDPPTLNEIKIFEQSLIHEFETVFVKECGNE